MRRIRWGATGGRGVVVFPCSNVGPGPDLRGIAAVRGAGRGIHRRIQSPARVWVEWFVGDRWPGGLGFLGGSLNPGLPPGATVFRPPAADSCDASVGVRRVVVGLSFSRVQMSGRGTTYVVSLRLRQPGRGLRD